MTESEIEELRTLRDDMRKMKDVFPDNYGECILCNRVAQRLDQAYALIRQLQERVREWSSN